jgi:hypothetical protein
VKVISYTGQGQAERLVVTGMVTSRDVLRVIAPVWNPKQQMLRSKWADLVGGWCVKYYQKYDKPPGGKIMVMLDRWMQEKRDKELAAQVQEYIRALDKGHVRDVDVKFTLDTANDLFTRVQQDRLVELLQKERDRPGSTAADFNKVIADNSRPVNLNDTDGSAIDDYPGMVAAFEARQESIIEYPGAAKDFFGDDLCRSGFVAFLAPEKRGKSSWMMDLCWRAMLQRLRVMFFSVGDLTMTQVRRRFAARACGRPIKPTKPGHPAVIPKKLVKVDKFWTVEGVAKEYSGHLSPEDFKKKYDDIRTNSLKSQDTFLRLWSYPASTLKASDIKTRATLLLHQGWRPDVIVVDYADILAPENGAAETRDQINATWKTLNSIRQELDCLVVTATQANAASYTSDRLSMANFSEDKRKFAHVTAMIGINQNEEEKKFKIQRLNYIVRREDEFYSARTLVCAGNGGAFNPCVLSVWPKDDEDDTEETPAE